MTQLSLIEGLSGADFSDDGVYRYQLLRTWDKDKPLFTYVGLNPSIANAERGDRTTTRNLKRARKLGAGSYIAVNLFAFVAKYPEDMKAAERPVGNRNDAAIMSAVSRSSWILCGWGFHGTHRGRDQEVLAMLKKNRIQAHCLGKTKDGQPRHPLYIADLKELEPMGL